MCIHNIILLEMLLLNRILSTAENPTVKTINADQEFQRRYSGKMPHLVLSDVPQEFLDVKKAYQLVSS